MNYMVYTLRQMDHPALNQASEERHFAWFSSLGETCKLASAFLDEAGTQITGGIVILAAGSLSEAEEIAKSDPFVTAGIYQTHQINRIAWDGTGT